MRRGQWRRGGEERPVEAHPPRLMVHLVLVPVTLGDLDQNVELHGASSLLRRGYLPRRLEPRHPHRGPADSSVASSVSYRDGAQTWV